MAQPRTIALWVILYMPLAFFLTMVGTELPVHETGEVAAYVMILILLLTPLQKVFGYRWTLYFTRRRRALGIAVFVYSMVHLILYLFEKNNWGAVLAESTSLSMGTGWLSLLVMVPLAATSTSFAMRTMGAAWKTLQRGVYAAGILMLVHWVLLSPEKVAAIVLGSAVIILQIMRIRKVRIGKSKTAKEAVR